MLISAIRQHKIFCLSPARINVCGKITVVCFDKTGTLTEDSLDMHSLIPVSDDKFSAPVTDPKTLEQEDQVNVDSVNH